MAKKNKNFRADTSGMQRLIRETPERRNQILRAAGEEIKSDIVLSFGDSPDGIAYTRGNVTHIASQPGYPPNVDTGALRASIHSYEESPGKVIVSDGVEYGIHLEDGTTSIEPRPFFAPVFEEWNRHKFEQFLKEQEIIK